VGWLRSSGKISDSYLEADREMERMGVVCATARDDCDIAASTHVTIQKVRRHEFTRSSR
jgi:hypothetical protein